MNLQRRILSWGALCVFLSQATLSWGIDLEVKVPSEILNKNTKLRVRNIKSGQERVFEQIQPSVQLGAAELAALGFRDIDALSQELDLAYLEYVEWKPRREVPVGLQNQNQRLGDSLIFDRPVWQRSAFRRVLRGEKLTVTMDPLLPLLYKAPAPVVARAESLSKDATKLFEIGWKSYQAKRYDLGLDAFTRLLDGRIGLDAGRKAEAHLGRAIGSFHQKGCDVAEQDFRAAALDPKNVDDAKYYAALCLVEKKNFESAGKQFQALVEKNHEKYAEPSRLYLGVVAEAREDYDAAQSAYLDTKDFASDPLLISIANEKLKALQARRQQNQQSRLFLGAFSTGLGFDTNVVSLPQELSASDFAVSDEKSGSIMASLYLEARPKLSNSLASSLSYSGLLLHYFKGDLAESYDVQSHDANLLLDYTLNSSQFLSFGAGYGSVYIGKISEFDEYMRTPSLTLKWQKYAGPVEDPKAHWETTFKAAFLRPVDDPAAAALDQTANSYVASVKYNVLDVKPHVFGPGVELEYRPAKGEENSFYALGLLGRWDSPLGPETWELFLTQELTGRYTNYFESSSGRKDYLLQYTGALSKPINSFLEARLQFQGLFNFSTEKSSFQYDKTITTLVLSAMF